MQGRESSILQGLILAYFQAIAIYCLAHHNVLVLTTFCGEIKKQIKQNITRSFDVSSYIFFRVVFKNLLIGLCMK